MEFHPGSGKFQPVPVRVAPFVNVFHIVVCSFAVNCCSSHNTRTCYFPSAYLVRRHCLLQFPNFSATLYGKFFQLAKPEPRLSNISYKGKEIHGHFHEDSYEPNGGKARFQKIPSEIMRFMSAWSTATEASYDKVIESLSHLRAEI